MSSAVSSVASTAVNCIPPTDSRPSSIRAESDDSQDGARNTSASGATGQGSSTSTPCSTSSCASTRPASSAPSATFSRSCPAVTPAAPGPRSTVTAPAVSIGWGNSDSAIGPSMRTVRPSVALARAATDPR